MKTTISASLDTSLVAKIGRSKLGVSGLVTKALNQFFHLDDENLDDLSDDELGEEYEKARLRVAALDSIGLERKARRDAETSASLEQQRELEARQNARIEARRLEREAKER